MKPSEKSDEIEKFIDSFIPNPLGRKDSIKSNVCTWCKKPIEHFRDELSKKEYIISGMCQECQDKTFGDIIDN